MNFSAVGAARRPSFGRIQSGAACFRRASSASLFGYANRSAVVGGARKLVEEVRRMIIVLVYVHVRPECVDAFRDASVENATHSMREPGVARFDVMQQNDDPERFVLLEVYRTAEDPARHKQTPHYAAWRDAVEPMMAEPRNSVKYTNAFPDDGSSQWWVGAESWNAGR
jgi:quinol monooxygenase YgiN